MLINISRSYSTFYLSSNQILLILADQYYTETSVLFFHLFYWKYAQSTSASTQDPRVFSRWFFLYAVLNFIRNLWWHISWELKVFDSEVKNNSLSKQSFFFFLISYLVILAGLFGSSRNNVRFTQAPGNGDVFLSFNVLIQTDTHRWYRLSVWERTTSDIQEGDESDFPSLSLLKAFVETSSSILRFKGCHPRIQRRTIK